MTSLASGNVMATDDYTRYDNVDIGTTVKCAVCNVNRFVHRYSKNQLGKYREAVYRQQRGGPRAPLPTCTQCTPSNVQEMKCTGCAIIKTLDAFSKVQRKKPDEAKCISCQQEILDRVPDLADAVEEEVIREEYWNRRAENTTAVSGMGSSLPSVSGSRSQAPSVTASGGVRIIHGSDGGGGWHLPSVPSSPTSSNVDLEDSGFSRTATTSRTASVYSGSNTRGFARQGAYRAPTETRVINQIHREESHQQQFQAGSRREESDSDGSEFEY